MRQFYVDNLLGNLILPEPPIGALADVFRPGSVINEDDPRDHPPLSENCCDNEYRYGSSLHRHFPKVRCHLSSHRGTSSPTDDQISLTVAT